MKEAKGVMSKNLLTIGASDKLINAYRLMHEKQIRHLPVTDTGGQIVGILSDRDLQRAMTVKRVNTFQQEVQINESILVEEFMSWPVYTVNENNSLKSVAELMLNQKVSCFLVENDEGKVKGIITTDDILKAFISEESIERGSRLKTVGYFFLGHPEL